MKFVLGKTLINTKYSEITFNYLTKKLSKWIIWFIIFQYFFNNFFIIFIRGLKLSQVSELPRGPVNTQVACLHSQSFWYIKSEVSPKNLYF